MVHGLNKIEQLRDVFFSPETGRARIAGGQTLEKLMANLAECSLYLAAHGSPTGFGLLDEQSK